MITHFARTSFTRITCTSTALRCFASGSAPTPEHSIYISESTDPYFNLSFEDWLFRHKSPDKPLLLLYRDEPCVVIGRNQNPWKEVNLRASRQTGIPFIRRHSGGGTVYHDLGNTNFSIHLPRASFDRHATAQVVLKAVRSLGVDANVNDRNDICVGKDKVSGSAYKIVKDRAYHHGTMLISTKLDTLGELLRSGKDTMETRGVASVRSPVCDLQQRYGHVDHEKFVRAVIDAFRKEYDVHEEVQMVNDADGTQNIEYIKHGMKELKTWDWAFGQTPEFTYKIEHGFPWGVVSAEIRSKHGVILSCSVACSESTEEHLKERLAALVKRLQGQRYGSVDDGITLLAEEDERVTGVWEWLRTEMDS
ncbi:Lipoyltransferase and lipoate-protein ligase [Dichomitus squalens]|uniref:Putative lipoate-protein ligase A n=1 Tax=Dichomitus squalens TaxID=114155 RepID=A0A4Q9Q763_9APHY|nr:Lipoyltransferase and lipoate-protein ligase [Dichomitus squalens]